MLNSNKNAVLPITRKVPCNIAAQGLPLSKPSFFGMLSNEYCFDCLLVGNNAVAFICLKIKPSFLGNRSSTYKIISKVVATYEFATCGYCVLIEQPLSVSTPINNFFYTAQD